ncbi:MAG TPA: GGDEF domain-containing protein [Burkholderiales bacterium]|nr:GGDEF domain-containing protein [Burkholderiales bacterium]
MKADTHLLVFRSGIDGEELAGLRLFAGADLDAVAEVMQECSMHVLREDEVLLAPGVVNKTLYLVLKGRLRVHLEGLESETVHHVETGDAVGEISLIDEKLTTAYVVADTATSVVAIDQNTFWALVNSSHAVARNMLLMLVERMRNGNAIVSEGMKMREEYRRQANVDELTGLRNGRALIDLLRRQMLRSSMGRKPFTLLMVDIDHLHGFNEEFGEAAGNNAVFATAQTLQDEIRPTDIATRVAGGKFAVLLPECDEVGAQIVAERLRQAVTEAVIVMADESILPSVTVSIGVAEMKVFEKAEQLIESADGALMRAKEKGCNTFSN